ncbi:MAG TPA: class I SAM-dependent methyltransferase [Bryobacteraceae bacterium]|nr:class I SAM-dependent methyltransferase [Bryobacteraceae bacterium]
MSSSPQAQAPSPGVVFDTLQAYQRSVALKAGIDLDLFTAIAEGNQTLSAIATRIQASEKGTRVLCDYLCMMGFLVKQGADYTLTADSAAFLNRRSPAYLGSMANFLMSPHIAEMFEDITGVIRHGGALPSDDGALEPEHPMWVEFARSMAPMMQMPAELIARMFAGNSKSIQVLDISAGHGLYGIAFARHNPNAKIVGLDWANVLEVAKENAAKAGVTKRYSTIPGSAFDVDLGSGYDIVLIPNFLHHFDPATNEKLLRKVHAALAPAGFAVTPDFIPNEDRISPPRDAMFSMQMLSTPAGDAYTFSELEKMFHNAGFARSEMRELSPFPQRLVVSYK